MGFCKARTVQGEQITAAAGKLWATTKVSRNSSSSNIVFIAFLLWFVSRRHPVFERQSKRIHFSANSWQAAEKP
jgi:hypothetical protein